MTKSKRKFWAVIVVVGIAGWLWLFPPRWWLNTIKPVDLTDPVAAGQAVVAKYGCRECHLVGDDGNRLRAPNLNDTTDRHDPIALRLWLQDPKAIRWKTLMPNFNLSDDEIEAIMAYLESLNPSREKPAS